MKKILRYVPEETDPLDVKGFSKIVRKASRADHGSVNISDPMNILDKTILEFGMTYRELTRLEYRIKTYRDKGLIEDAEWAICLQFFETFKCLTREAKIDGLS